MIEQHDPVLPLARKAHSTAAGLRCAITLVHMTLFLCLHLEELLTYYSAMPTRLEGTCTEYTMPWPQHHNFNRRVCITVQRIQIDPHKGLTHQKSIMETVLHAQNACIRNCNPQP